MKKEGLRTTCISLGAAFLISTPICHFAVQSWDNSPQIKFEHLPESVDWSHLSIEAKAHEIFERQELLDSYGVEVPQDIQTYCEQAQEEFNVCAELLEAIAFKESRYTETAEYKGCSGLMQISTRWHRDRMKKLGVSDIYDAQGNIRVGADYLAELFELYDGDLYRVLMTYNGDTSKGVSEYAKDIAEISEALERVHGK